MDRSISDIDILSKFTKQFCDIVQNHVDYFIMSGFVAISTGRARGTEDIDMIIKQIEFDVFDKLHNDLLNNEFACIQGESSKEIYSYLKDNLSVRYVWKNHFLPEMEVKFAKDQIDDEQFERRLKIDLVDIDVWFSPVEYNVAFKEEYLKADKDIEDAQHLRIIFDLDENEINRIKELIKRIRL